MWKAFCWFFKIGWGNPIVWVGEQYVEETWVHNKTKEVRVVRRPNHWFEDGI